MKKLVLVIAVLAIIAACSGSVEVHGVPNEIKLTAGGCDAGAGDASRD